MPFSKHIHRSLALGCVAAMGCTASVDVVDLAAVTAACAEGQVATPGRGGGQPQSLSDEWVRYSEGPIIAVLARRAGPRADRIPPLGPQATSEHYLAYCLEGAEHTITDGLGWMEEGTVEIRSTTGRTYWTTETGVPQPDVDIIDSGFFFDEETQSLAPDEEEYLLILRTDEDGNLSLISRYALNGGMVSGAATVSGEDAAVDLYRAP